MVSQVPDNDWINKHVGELKAYSMEGVTVNWLWTVLHQLPIPASLGVEEKKIPEGTSATDGKVYFGHRLHALMCRLLPLLQYPRGKIAVPEFMDLPKNKDEILVEVWPLKHYMIISICDFTRLPTEAVFAARTISQVLSDAYYGYHHRYHGRDSMPAYVRNITQEFGVRGARRWDIYRIDFHFDAGSYLYRELRALKARVVVLEAENTLVKSVLESIFAPDSEFMVFLKQKHPELDGSRELLSLLRKNQSAHAVDAEEETIVQEMATTGLRNAV